MKLVYITASFPFGKGESFLISEINALNNQKINLLIIPIFPRGSYRNDFNLLSSNKIYTHKLLSIKIILTFILFLLFKPFQFIKQLSLLKGTTFFKTIKNLTVLPKAIWIASIIKKENPKHIHVHWGGTTSTAAMIAANIASVPWSTTCHRWDIYENNLLEIKSKKSSFIRFISERGKLDAIKLGVIPHKSIVIPMGTQIPNENPSSNWEGNKNYFNIICPANLIPVKGHIYLINAIELLINKGYNINLLLAGDGILKEKLQSTVIKKRLEHKITFLGHLSHLELLSYYKNSNIQLMVLPSIDLGNGEHEGIPVSLMEAMSYGVPVLSTNTGSINELLPESLGFTVPEKDYAAIASKIKILYDNPDIYYNYSLKCREIIIRKWDIEKSTEKLVTQINNLNSEIR